MVDVQQQEEVPEVPGQVAQSDEPNPYGGISRFASTASSNYIPTSDEVADELVSELVDVSSSLAHALTALEVPGGGKRVAHGWVAVKGSIPPTWHRIDDPHVMVTDIPSEHVIAARKLVELRDRPIMDSMEGRGRAVVGFINMIQADVAPAQRAEALKSIKAVMEVSLERFADGSPAHHRILSALNFTPQPRAREVLLAALPMVVAEKDDVALDCLLNMLDDPDARNRAAVVSAISTLVPKRGEGEGMRQEEVPSGGGETVRTRPVKAEEKKEREDEGKADGEIEMPKGAGEFKRIGPVGEMLESRLSIRAKDHKEAWFSREAAFLALGSVCRRGDAMVIETCVGVASEGDAMLKVAALRALGGAAPHGDDGKECRECLVGALQDASQSVRDAAIDSILDMLSGRRDADFARRACAVIDEDAASGGFACSAGVRLLRMCAPVETLEGATTPPEGSENNVWCAISESLAKIISGGGGSSLVIACCDAAKELLARGGGGGDEHQVLRDAICGILETVDITTNTSPPAGLKVPEAGSFGFMGVTVAHADDFRGKVTNGGEAVGVGKVRSAAVRRAAMEALGRISPLKCKQAIGAAFFQTIDRDPEIRRCAVQVVIDVARQGGARNPVVFGVSMLKDKDSQVRALAGTCVLSLSKKNDKGTLLDLYPLLDGGWASGTSAPSREAATRARAAFVLSELIDPQNSQAKEEVGKRMQSKNPEIREVIVQCLVDIAVKDAGSTGKVVSLLLPLFSDPEWFVRLAAVKGVTRLEATRVSGGSKTVYHSKEAREEARAPCTWSTGTAKGLVRLLCDTVDGERSALVREAALEGLERVCARGDGGIVGNVLRGLMHEEEAVRKFTVEALRRLTSAVESSSSSSRGLSRPTSPQGKGLLAKGTSKALDMGKEKERADAVVDVTVNEVLGFLKKIMDRVSKPAKLEVERDAIVLKLTRPGVDKKPLIKEMERLEQELSAQRLSSDERRLVEGQMQTVMDCLHHVVPQGHHGAIEGIVACLEDASYAVRTTAQQNIFRIAGKDNRFAIGCIASQLASVQTYTRWSAAETLLVMNTKGDRECLAQILVLIDHNDRYVRQDIVGALVGILLEEDYMVIIEGLGSNQVISKAKEIAEQGRKIKATAEAKSKELQAKNSSGLKKVRRLQHEIDSARRDLGDEGWLDANACLVVTQRREGLEAALLELRRERDKAEGNDIQEWQELEDNTRELKILCLDILQHKFSDDRARRGATNILVSQLPGLKEYGKNIAGGVSNSWMSSTNTSVSKAKSAFSKKGDPLKDMAQSSYNSNSGGPVQQGQAAPLAGLPKIPG